MDIQQEIVTHFKKTKMICTIGPATDSYDSLEKLVHIGMNAARLNFSHGSYDEFSRVINDLRNISKKHNRPLAIIQDLQGPKIRVGNLEKSLQISSNQKFYLGEGIDNNLESIPLQYNFIPYLENEHTIFFNDGYLKAKVIEKHDTYAVIRFLNTGIIESNKGINIPDTLIPNAALTEKDLRDLEFGLEHDVDYVALSFVQSENDINYARSIIDVKRPGTKIIAKIETKGAIKNIDEIINTSDAILIARGDLAIEIGMENVPIEQVSIIKKCKKMKKPVFVATQMLESMITNPRPTRAEVNDVANATMQRADAVMLSGESAIGAFPFDATETMRSIVKSTEHRMYISKKSITNTIDGTTNNTDAVTYAAALLANQISAEMIAIATKSGRSAISLSSLRPHKTIVAITQSEKVYNQLALVWGIKSFILNENSQSTIDGLIDQAVKCLEDINYLKEGSKIIFVTGLQVGIEGETNSLRIVDITH